MNGYARNGFIGAVWHRVERGLAVCGAKLHGAEIVAQPKGRVCLPCDWKALAKDQAS